MICSGGAESKCFTLDSIVGGAPAIRYARAELGCSYCYFIISANEKDLTSCSSGSTKRG